MIKSLISDIQWDDRGLVTVVVQDYKSAKILMVAWANEAAIIKSIDDGRSCFWTRSRSALWLQGVSSGD